MLGHIDFREEILTGRVPEFTCLVGTMVQEVYETCPAIRQACDASISGHAAKLEADIEDISNEMGAFTVVRAESNEAAAKLFENHPHFTIFPGESVEVMPVLPIPGA